MKRVLGLLPGWLWLLLLVAGAFLVQEYRVQAALRSGAAAREAQFGAALQAIEAQRLEQERGVRALTAERERLKADLAAHAGRVAALERQRVAAGEAVSRATEAEGRLVASGSLAEVLRALEALGAHPLPGPRPRP